MSKQEIKILRAKCKNGSINQITQATDIQALVTEIEHNQAFIARAKQPPQFCFEKTVAHRDWKRKAVYDARRRNTLIEIRLKELGSDE